VLVIFLRSRRFTENCEGGLTASYPKGGALGAKLRRRAAATVGPEPKEEPSFFPRPRQHFIAPFNCKEAAGRGDKS
jgi:hypothetical protein